MITSGIVITLNADAALARQAQTTLQARPGLTLGELNARWLPVALEAADVGASRDLHDWLNTVPGVDFVDVVEVNFGEEENAEAPPGFGLRRQSGSGDGAFERAGNDQTGDNRRACESGVALRFPPQSKPLACPPTTDSSASRPELVGTPQTQER
jgi:hypothetical protein